MKKRRFPSSALPSVVVPITPMLDMTFQLLFFFLLRYNPNALEGQMEMSLPTPVEPKSQQQDSNTIPSGSDLDSPAKVTLVVRTRQDEDKSKISQITVKVTVQDVPTETSLQTPDGKLDTLIMDLQDRLSKNELEANNTISI